MPGPNTPARGERVGTAKLTERDVLAIRRMRTEDGLCRRCVAKIFNVHYMTVRRIERGESWPHVPCATP